MALKCPPETNQLKSLESPAATSRWVRTSTNMDEGAPRIRLRALRLVGEAKDRGGTSKRIPMFGRRRGPFDLPRRPRGAWRSPSFIHARADESVGEGGRGAASKNRSGHFRRFHRGGSISPRACMSESASQAAATKRRGERHDQEDEKNQSEADGRRTRGGLAGGASSRLRCCCWRC